MGRASPSRMPAVQLKWANLSEPLAIDLLRAMGYTHKAALRELQQRIARDQPLPRKLAC